MFVRAQHFILHLMILENILKKMCLSGSKNICPLYIWVYLLNLFNKLWINKLSMIHLFKNLESEGAKKSKY